MYNNMTNDKEKSTTLKVLVLDDERNILDSIKRMVHATEFDCDIISNVPAALELMKINNYDIVLFDYLMPIMSGLTFVAQAKEKQSDVIMILITAYADKNIINEFFSLGVSGYLLKPFTKEDLLGALRTHVERKRNK